MRSGVCGVSPSSLLVWGVPSAFVVARRSGRSVSSGGKPSELHKPPRKCLVLFSVCLQAVFHPPPKRRGGSRLTKLLWQRENLPVQNLGPTIFNSCLLFRHLSGCSVMVNEGSILILKFCRPLPVFYCHTTLFS